VIRYYTDEDRDTLKQMYEGYYSVSEIAKKLNRSKESVSQKVRLLGLKRDTKLALLIILRGGDRDLLKLGKNYDDVIKAVKKRDEDKRANDRASKLKKENKALVELKINLEAGCERNVAIKLAHLHGARQIAIAALLGMSKQNISLIVKPKKKRRR
jgi:IS30 family transposase